MSDEQIKKINHYWHIALQRYQYFDNHNVEWLRNAAHQLSLVNSLGATLSVALAAGMAAPILLLPAFIFFVGAGLILLATILLIEETRSTL